MGQLRGVKTSITVTLSCMFSPIFAVLCQQSAVNHWHLLMNTVSLACLHLCAPASLFSNAENHACDFASFMSLLHYVLLFCVQTAAATATVGNSMATASAAMASVGQAANPAKMQQTMQQVPLLLLLLFLLLHMFTGYLCNSIHATHPLPSIFMIRSGHTTPCMLRDSGVFLTIRHRHISCYMYTSSCTIVPTFSVKRCSLPRRMLKWIWPVK